MVKKQYDSIDLMKFIACLFVVAIHADPLYDISPFANAIVSWGIARLAVPLFFLSSSFFLFNNFSKEKVKHYCSRLLILYGCWFVILLPSTIFNRFLNSPDTIGITIFKFVKSFFFTSTFSGSWYLVSCVFCALLFLLLEKLPNKFRQAVTICLAAVVYLFCVFTSAYGGFIDKLGLTNVYETITFYFAKPYTSILVGIPYFALGKHLCKNAKEGKQINPKLSKVLIVFFLVLLLIEIIFVNKNKLYYSTDCYLLLLPTAYLIFEMIIHMDIKLKRAKPIRIASTVIFFSQFAFLFIIDVFANVTGLTVLYILKFVITVVLCVLTTIIIEKLQPMKKFNWLKYLY